MYLYRSNIFAILLASLSVTFADPECKNFTLSQSNATFNYTVPHRSTFRVSKALICPDGSSENSTECALTASGHITLTPYTNSSDLPWEAEDSGDPYFQPIAERAQELGNEPAFGLEVFKNDFNGSGETLYVRPGQAGYVAFTPIMQCFDGVVSDCDDDDNNGSGVSVCEPSEENNTIFGRVNMVSTDEETAKSGDMQSNPADSEEGTGDVNKNAAISMRACDGCGSWAILPAMILSYLFI